MFPKIRANTLETNEKWQQINISKDFRTGKHNN